MKYIAIIDSDDELSEDAIKELKDTVFIGDEETPYGFNITNIKQAPRPRCNLKGITEEDFWERVGYDRALRDCGLDAITTTIQGRNGG
ncbi:hypothetical protein [Eubacterium oxidoreducens]|uniref:Uncharacterized protein n=1 Tax=Eubacterium oxidoreducens TaxID=1732 RepID=A0A1G6B391_EUBOX|nr:hypothetical protein [Eubacterium oxidoreducens]SDB15147.1 hypothetical protein SAMN02910417_01118 [Eubacterium oxidoreducens]